MIIVTAVKFLFDMASGRLAKCANSICDFALFVRIRISVGTNLSQGNC